MRSAIVLTVAIVLAALSRASAAESWVQSPMNGHWYAVTKLAVDWDTAQSYARSFGGNLATIRSATERTWILNKFSPANPLWIGLNDVTTEGTFEWVSGEAVTYKAWNPGEPNNANGGEDYAEMLSSGQWNDAPGVTLRQALLEVGPMAALMGTIPGPPTSDEELPVVTPWVQSPISGLWYARTLVGMTWPDAKVFAKTVGGNIATVRSPAENAWIMTTFAGVGELFIGLSDELVEGTFVWDSGEPVTYTHWAAGEPNNVGNEDYASFRTDGFWNDLPGSSVLSTLIERVSPDGITYYGTGCAGSGGFVPKMQWAGSTQGGSALTLHVQDGLGGSQVLLLLAGNKGSTAINAFCTLNLGAPLFPAPIGPISLGGSGAGQGSVSLFAGLPPVTATVGFAMQAFVIDPGAPSGYANSVGMAVQLHP